jgi:8-oxo-dGTP pyrophosphatase MutT (NUDIX family)
VPPVNAWVLRRHAARVILLDPDGRVFLINSIDPNDASKPAWWEIPGGGIDPGEPSADAVARELREEAGIDEAVIGPIVYTQYVEFSFGGYDFEQDEVLHVAHTDQTDIRPPRGLEYLEALAFQGARWWTLEEVQASTEPFLPPSLPALLPRLIAGDLPDPPIDITGVAR